MILRGDQLEIGIRVKAVKNLLYLKVKGRHRFNAATRTYYRRMVHTERYGTVCMYQYTQDGIEQMSVCWDGRQGYSTVGGTQTRYKVITP